MAVCGADRLDVGEGDLTTLLVLFTKVATASESPESPSSDEDAEPDIESSRAECGMSANREYGDQIRTID
jgi:hypothetical protein